MCNCKKETFTPLSLLYYCLAFAALLPIPILCVYQIVIYYSYEVQEFSINEYF